MVCDQLAIDHAITFEGDFLLLQTLSAGINICGTKFWILYTNITMPPPTPCNLACQCWQWYTAVSSSIQNCQDCHLLFLADYPIIPSKLWQVNARCNRTPMGLADFGTRHSALGPFLINSTSWLSQLRKQLFLMGKLSASVHHYNIMTDAGLSLIAAWQPMQAREGQ